MKSPGFTCANEREPIPRRLSATTAVIDAVLHHLLVCRLNIDGLLPLCWAASRQRRHGAAGREYRACPYKIGVEREGTLFPERERRLFFRDVLSVEMHFSQQFLKAR